MTATAPAHRAAPPMTQTPDPVTSQGQTFDDAVAERPARPRLRDQVADNPLASLVGGLFLALLAFFGTVIVALLVFALTSMNDRFDSLESRMDRLEDKVDAQGAQIAELDARLTAQIAELDRKLTALIAHLNATAAVDAALEHRLVVPGADTLEPDDEPPS